jgi:putative colanic acid biosynthesis UDP-glucose lipid carrier transferase
LGRLVGALGLSFLTLVAIGFLLKVSPDYSRGWLLAWFGLLLLILPLGRLLSAHVMKGLESAGYMTRRIALIESRERPNELVDRLRRTPGIRLVGIFGDSPTTTQTGPRASISDLIEIGQHNQIDEVIVDLSNVSRPQLERLLDALGVLPVNVWLCDSDIGRPVLTTAQLGSYNLLQIKPRPIGEWGALAKMAIDYSGSLIALILFAPLMMAVALAIKLDSRGPVFFRQRRHGYNHRVIDVIKFRTMHVTEDGNHIEQARKGDPRVTRVGRLLRHSSLDELPQLFNVLKGEMSLVGPRPHALAHNRFYGEKLERYANRHCVKPGITGWAQINGCRGQTEDLEQMRRRIEMDLYYIENWSLLLDLRILALTSFLGFVNRNAF